MAGRRGRAVRRPDLSDQARYVPGPVADGYLRHRSVLALQAKGKTVGPVAGAHGGGRTDSCGWIFSLFFLRRRFSAKRTVGFCGVDSLVDVFRRQEPVLPMVHGFGPAGSTSAQYFFPVFGPGRHRRGMRRAVLAQDFQVYGLQPDGAAGVSHDEGFIRFQLVELRRLHAVGMLDAAGAAGLARREGRMGTASGVRDLMGRLEPGAAGEAGIVLPDLALRIRSGHAGVYQWHLLFPLGIATATRTLRLPLPPIPGFVMADVALWLGAADRVLPQALLG